MKYFFELTGLRMKLCVPEKIQISRRLQPFLTEPRENTDCTIRVRKTNTLPRVSNAGIPHGLEFYDRTEHAMRIFHCTADTRTPFAVTEFLASGDVEISVLPAYLFWLSGSSGIFNRIGMETLLLQHNGLLLHASLINYNGAGIAFTGPSGVGKSTQAGLWEKYLQAGIINGDRAALRKDTGGWTAYGSPYAGTSGIYCNKQAPLTAIVALKQGKENSLRRLSPTEAFAHVYPELSIHHWDRSFTEQATDLCVELLLKTPVYLLECVPQESAVSLLKKGLAL